MIVEGPPQFVDPRMTEVDNLSKPQPSPTQFRWQTKIADIEYFYAKWFPGKVGLSKKFG